MSWFSNGIGVARRRIRGWFFTVDGGKEIIRVGRAMAGAGFIVFLGVLTALYIGSRVDSSFFKKSDHSIVTQNGGPPSPVSGSSGNVGKMLQNSEKKGTGERPHEPHRGRGLKINFKAQQVLVSEGAFDPARTMPMGTNLIGKTLTTIDTRQSDQLVKVLLPYGGRADSGGSLPKNTVLFGQVTYGGKGEKVFVKFQKGVLPSGEEIQVEAQGLGPADYSPGLVGRFHGNADMRVASTLGLTMVAGMTNVLTEREAIGGSALLPGSVTPKATMKNALLQGTSQVAQSEASRQADAIGQEQEYVTVDAGTDLIVSLTKAYVQK